MPRVPEDLRREAQRRFLGEGAVIGVAVGGEFEDELVFLLEEESNSMAEEIRAWGTERGVAIRIQVSGPFEFLSA
jgi:hypothetical protein